MGKVYTSQEFTLYVNTGINLSNAANVFIQGTLPDGTSMVAANGTIDDVTKGIIRYDAPDDKFTTSGTWTLWAYVDFNGGDAAWGEPFHLNIYSSGT